MGSCGSSTAPRDLDYQCLATTVDPGKHIDAERNTVSGYVRRISQPLLNEKRVDDVISIISFYLYYYKPQFQKTTYREYIYFLSDAIVTITKDHNIWSTVLFGSQITSNVCNKFDIFIRVDADCFCIGYVKQKLFMEPNVSYFLGKFNNSIGINISLNDNKIKLYNENNRKFKILNYVNHIKDRDLFILSFNFEQDYLEIFHKEHKLIKLSLNGQQKIIPAFSLLNKNDLLEVVKWKIR